MAVASKHAHHGERNKQTNKQTSCPSAFKPTVSTHMLENTAQIKSLERTPPLLASSLRLVASPTQVYKDPLATSPLSRPPNGLDSTEVPRRALRAWRPQAAPLSVGFRLGGGAAGRVEMCCSLNIWLWVENACPTGDPGKSKQRLNLRSSSGFSLTHIVV